MAAPKTGGEAVEAMLHERSGAGGRGTHGPYAEWARTCADLCRVMEASPNWHALTDDQRETLRMTAHKQARILTGDPEAPDHWKDIAGYATLSHREVVRRAEAAAELREKVAERAEPAPAAEARSSTIVVALDLDTAEAAAKARAVGEKLLELAAIL